MTASRIEYLFEQYVNNRCSEAEKEELMLLLSEPENEAILKSLIQELIRQTGSEIELSNEKADAILTNILHKEPGVVVPMRRNRIPFIRVAAAVLIVVFAGASYYWMENKKEKSKEKIVVAPVKPAPILPGSDKAILTMADGSSVVLDDLKNGTLDQSNATIKKKGALLIYNAGTLAKPSDVVTYNTLSTPRGGQYKVILSDGTQVWLNAASSIRFPTVFTGSTREVQLTGEAYFEVAKNKHMPFHVNVNGMQVNVLGTHFNINAYSEESSIKTSLLEGSVQIVNGSYTNQIKPGEQAIVSAKNDVIDVRMADMEAVMAWKNGLFEFEGADIATIMRQISRWYDVEIAFVGKTPMRRFKGKISRNAQLSDVLEILELSNIKFTVEGKKIIVQ